MRVLTAQALWKYIKFPRREDGKTKLRVAQKTWQEEALLTCLVVNGHLVIGYGSHFISLQPFSCHFVKASMTPSKIQMCQLTIQRVIADHYWHFYLLQVKLFYLHYKLCWKLEAQDGCRIWRVRETNSFNGFWFEEGFGFSKNGFIFFIHITEVKCPATKI